jgi:hypothetical protein
VHRVAEEQVETLQVAEHVHCFLRAGFALEPDPSLARRRYGRYAHALGYRGHCLTKSRRYSTTFKALRDARELHVHQQLRKRLTDTARGVRTELGAADRVKSSVTSVKGISQPPTRSWWRRQRRELVRSAKRVAIRSRWVRQGVMSSASGDTGEIERLARTRFGNERGGVRVTGGCRGGDLRDPARIGERSLPMESCVASVAFGSAVRKGLRRLH